MNKQKGFIVYMAAAIVLLVAVIALLWMRLDKVAEQRDKAKAALVSSKKSMEIEYANAQKELDIARAESATRAGLLRLCRKVSVPVSAAGPAVSPGADPDAGELGRLASDVIACRRNGARLGALQDWVRMNSE